MKTKLSGRFWCALTLFSLMGQIAWVVENMYFNVFIYKMFHASAGDISLMVAASAVAATLTTVFMGALSDRIGKRKLFICGGYILWGISIFSFLLLRTEWIAPLLPMTVSSATGAISLTIALDCIMTFFGSTANDAAFNAWLTDSTDETNRGAAEGINAMMPLIAILAVFGGFMAFDLNLPSSWSIIFCVIGVATLIVGILGFFLIREPDIVPDKTGYFSTIFYGFRPKTILQNKSLYTSLGLFILFNISIQIFMPYLILYYEVSLGMKDYVLIMAPAILIAAVVTAFWGRFYDKKGMRLSCIISLIWLILGFALLALLKTTLPVFLGSLFMMCGYLAGMAVFGAAIRDLTPKGKSGRLQGVRIFAQVLVPGVIGPFIGKSVLSNAETVVNNDGTTSFIPNQNIFYAALAVAVVVLILLLIFVRKKAPRTVSLPTPFENELTEIPYAEHPRPQMARDGYMSLNGLWHFSKQTRLGETPMGKILVPFPPESRCSGIEKIFSSHDVLIYRRTFLVPDEARDKTLLLHFDAVDQECTVFLNGSELGNHVGGYSAFSFDITDLVTTGENQLSVFVTDSTDTVYPYGKQRKKRGGMWYTPISGIWQSVWLEWVPKLHIKDLKITTDTQSVTIQTVGGDLKNLTIFTDKGEENFSYSGNEFTYRPENPHLWSPDDPFLYRFTLTSGEDKITSYFAMRSLTVTRGKNHPILTLNGEPIFLNGLLDQGYYSDGVYLPATPKGYEFDILTMKKLGFNLLRKHIKLEPECFYYLCDLHGVLVMQDMVNNGKYSFLIDTALPTAGLKRGIKHRAFKKQILEFETLATETVNRLQNHPSVIAYTIFNEGWGQYSDGSAIYDKLKSIDPTRLYDTASGWFYPKKSDFESHHIYFKPIRLKPTKLPLLLSEFGGYSCKIKGHSFNLDKTYGYRTCKTPKDFEDDLLRLYNDEILPAVEQGLVGAVLTQVSDVEDETNGLITYDRKVVKLRKEALKKVFAKINNAVLSQK